MNKIYRLVWNAVQRAWVVAGEFATAKGKGKTMPRRLSVKLAGVAGAGMVALLAVEPARAWMIDPVAILNGSAATDNGNSTNTAIGDNAIASSSANNGAITALGWNARAMADWSTALGANSLAEANESTAIGQSAKVYSATSTYSTVIGSNAGISANSPVATVVGSYAIGTGMGATVLGAQSQALGKKAVAVGHAAAAVGEGAMALGGDSQALAAGALAAGYGAKANTQNDIAIGTGSSASGSVEGDIIQKAYSSIAIGRNSLAQAATDELDVRATAIGDSAKATGTLSTAIGGNAVAGGSATAIGGSAKANAKYATAIGYEASANGEYAVSIGYRASSTGINAVAIGGANASASQSLAIGSSAHATLAYDIALGYHAITNFGGTNAGNVGTVTIGSFSEADKNSISMGYYARAKGSSSVALGAQAFASGSGSIALGSSTQSLGTRSIALGSVSNASVDYGMALGASSTTSTIGGVALGHRSQATTDAGIAGYQSAGASAAQAAAITATTSTQGAVSVGDASSNLFRQINGVAAGTMDSDAVNVAQLRALAETPLKYFHANSTGTDSVASGADAVAIGMGAVANASKSVALGAGSLANGNTLSHQAYLVGGTAQAEVNVGDRRITGLSAGADDTDAVNVAQLRAVSAGAVGDAVMYDSTAHNRVTLGGDTYNSDTQTGGAKITNVANGTAPSDAVNFSQLNTIYTTGTKYFHANSTGIDSQATGADAIAVGQAAQASGVDSMALGAASQASGAGSFAAGYTAKALTKNDIAIGTNASASGSLADSDVNYDLSSIAIGRNSTALSLFSPGQGAIAGGGQIAIGDSATSLGHASIALGVGATSGNSVSAGFNIAIGLNARALNANDTAIGDSANATGFYSLALGTRAKASGHASMAMGLNAEASGLDATAIGRFSYASGARSVALAGEARASGDTSMALGYTSMAYRDGSVALGSGSIANKAAGIAGFIPAGTNAERTAAIAATTSNLAGVSVGNADYGQFRQIHSVAAGAADSDAVNVAQLKATTADIVLYDNSAHNSVTLGGSGAAAPVALTNVAAGSTPNDAVNFSQLNSIDTTGTKYFHANSTGTDSFASGADAVAIGMGAIASADNSVALGAGSLADGSTLSHQAYLVGGTARAEVNVGDRRITGLSAGADDADAVNLAQLRQVTAGSVADAVVYDSTAHNRVTLGGTGATAPVALTNVANGVAASDAVNVSQLTELTNTGTKYFHANSTGTDSSATGQDAVAIGMGAVASADNSVALGAGSLADGSTLSQQAYLVGGTATGEVNVGDRRITGLSAGAAGTDAVNVAQLMEVATGSVADAVVYDSSAHNRVTLGTTGATAPVALSNVAAGALTTTSTDAVNGSQLFATNQAIDGLQTGSVLYDTLSDGSPDYSSVTLGGDSYNATTQTGGTTLTNVANGVAASDAVNVSQLTETNNNITELGDDITTIYGRGIKYFHANSTGALASATGQDAVAIGMGAVADVARSVALGDGAKTQAAVGTRSVTLNGTEYLFAGQAPVGTVSVGDVGAERTLTHVAAGRLSDSSTDAINGSQLFATNQAIDGLQTGSVLYDTLPDGSPDYSSVTLGGDSYNATTQTGGTTITNVANGVAASDAVNVSQLTALTNTGTKYFHANSTGTDSSATGQDAVAIGMGAVASADNSVALGAGSLADGSTLSQQAYLVGGTATGEVNVGERRITGLSAGAAGTDAVNVAQLMEVATGSVADAVMYDSTAHNRVTLGTTGATAPVALTNVAAGALTTTSTDAVNGSQLFATNQAIDGLQTGSVLYDTNPDGSPDYSSVTLGGDSYNATTQTGGTTLTNVANGVAASDAVNVSQLTETNNNITELGDDITTIYGRGIKYFHANSTGALASATGQDAVAIGMGAVADVARSVALGDGAKTQAAVGTRSVTLNGTEYLFAGQAPVGTVSVGDVGAERTLTHVAAGRLSDSSTDAINGSQLFATNQAIDGLQTGSVLYDTLPDGSPDYSSVTLGGDSYNATTQTGGTTITNVANGVAASDAVNVSQLTALTNTGTKYFHANSTGTDSSATGQDAVAIGMGAVASADNSVALGAGSLADGSTLSQQAYLVGGTATGEVNVGERRITGLSAGAAGTDAVNVAQLMEVATGSVADAVMYDSTAHNRVTLGTTGATAPVALTNVAAGALTTTSTDAINGSQLFATNQAIDGLQTGSVLYDTNPDGSPDYSSVTLGGDSYNATTQTGGTTLTNVANGVAASDAVNVSQLTALTNTGTKYFHANSTGTDSSATGQDAVAIGMGAVASHSNSVALGAGSQTAAAVGTAGATIGGNDYLFAGTAPTSTVSVGDVGAERTLTHVAAGRLSDSSTDAINGSQLFATNQAIDGLQTGSVLYDTLSDGSPDYSSVTLGGDSYNATTQTGGTTLTNVANGVAASDAVNVSQLTALTNTGTKYFHANSTGTDSSATGQDAVAIGMGAVADVARSVALGDGAKTQAAVGTRSVTLNGTEYLFAGQAPVGTVSVGDVGAERTLTHVAAGRLSDSSTDAINGSQLFATNQAIDGLQTGSVLYDTLPDGSPDYSSVTLGGDSYNATTQTGGTTLTNVANGVAASDAVNVSQLTALTNTGTKYFHANSTGTDSSATGQDAVAIGMGAIASADNSVALGAGSLADGSTLSQQAYLVGGTATGEVNVGDRRITGLSAGAAGTDAVNVAQLMEVATGSVADAVMYDSTAHNRVTLGTTGATAPVALSNVAAGALTTTSTDAINGSQLFATNQAIDGLQTGSVLYDSLSDGSPDYSSVTLGGDSYNATTQTGGTTITNVANGVAASDAVNVSQLTETNNNITELGDDITTIYGRGIKYFHANSTGALASATGQDAVAIGMGAVADVARSVALGDGAKTQAAVGTRSVTLNGTEYLFAGQAPVGTVSVGDVGAERTLTHVAAGRLSDSSTDAINGSQLFATNQAIDGLQTGSVLYDTLPDGSPDYSSVTLGGDSYNATTQTGGTTLTNVANGVAASDAVNVSQLTALTNTGTKYFHANSTGTDSSATGQDAVAIGMGAIASADNSVALGAGSLADGSTLSQQAYLVGGTATGEVNVGDRRITGLSAGAAGTDAVNVAQLMEVATGSVADAVMYDSTAHNRVTLGTTGATAPVALTNVAAGALTTTSTDAINGSQLFATNQAIDGLQTGSVLYDTNPDGSPDYSSVTLGGDSYNATTQTGGTTLTNVANGVAASDAVNVSQLTETNNNITELGDDITTIYGRGIKYFHANSTGALASATGQDAVAIGMGAVASHSNSVALGAGSQTAAAVGTAGATIGGNDYLFAGTAPTSTVSVGDVGAERTLTHVAAGRLSGNSTDAVNGSQLFATNSQVDINTTDISNLGDDITNLGDEVTNIFGQGIKYFHANSTGALASATGQDAVAIGMGALASANNSVALGAGSLADGSTLSHQAYLVGGTATGEVNVGNRRITGLSAGAEDADAVNVAQLREVTAGSVADAVMYDSSAHNRVTLGGSRATAPVALTNVAAGALTSTSTDAVNGAQLKSTNDQVDINTTNIANHTVDIRGLKQDALLWDTSLGAFSANHTGSGPNKITNVAKGTLSETSTDAVNGAQLYAVNNNVTNLENVINNLRPTDVKYLKVNSSSTASVATGSEAIAIGPDAVASGNSSIASGKGAQSSGLSSIAMGTEANASADGSIATGNHAKASGLDSVAIGNSANATASNAVALGANSVADRADSVSVGAAGKERQIVNVAAGTRDTDAVNLAQLNKVTGDITNIDNTVNNISSGTDGMFQVNNTDGLPKPVVEGKNALAGGAGSAASGDNSMAVGTSAKSSGVDSVALGNSSYATAKNSVALGANSVADRENTISVGSVGSERQIANVAAGTQGTDAVNVTQLNSSISNANNYTDNKFSSLKNMIDDNKDKMSAGVAGAMAMASLPQPYSPGASLVSMGGATFQNQSSVALGVSTISDNGKWVTKFSGSTNTQNDLGVSVGVGYQW